MRYSLVSFEESDFEGREFVHEIKLGDGRFYYVLEENRPYLKVEVDTKQLFDDAVVFNKHLLIGLFDEIIFINLLDFNIKRFEVEMYFGRFEIYKDFMYILVGNGIIAFDTNLNEVWRNLSLAVDGVSLIEIINDEIMSLSCEMDPPGGWVDKLIDIKSGEIILEN